MEKETAVKQPVDELERLAYVKAKEAIDLFGRRSGNMILRTLSKDLEKLDIPPQVMVRQLRRAGAEIALQIDHLAIDLEPELFQKPSLDGPLHRAPSPNATEQSTESPEPTEPA